MSLWSMFCSMTICWIVFSKRSLGLINYSLVTHVDVICDNQINNSIVLTM